MTDLPAYMWVLVALGVIGLPAATCLVLYGAARRAGRPGRAALRATGGVAAALAGWLGLCAVLGGAGLLQQRPGELRPGLGLLFLGVIVALLAATRIPAVARLLDVPGSGARLMLPHTVRVAGVLFLVAMALGALPAVFALPAGLGDILVGLSAPLAYRRHLRGSASAARWFHISGIADLAVAVTIGFLAGLGPYRVLDVAPTTAAVSVLPLVLVPTVAVPLAVALHIVSWRRLAAHARHTATMPSPALG